MDDQRHTCSGLQKLREQAGRTMPRGFVEGPDASSRADPLSSPLSIRFDSDRRHERIEEDRWAADQSMRGSEETMPSHAWH
ncbi:MAG: hypothetical protein OXC38_06920 [Gammaproteobacteria bacterium]|nr:hypothetical protein [Gammaproteobacteria bacterium]